MSLSGSGAADARGAGVRGAGVRGTAERATGADISELLGLHTRGARLILAVYVASNLAFAASTAYVLDHPWASFLAVGLVTVGGIVVTRPQPDPFALRLTHVVLAIVVVSSVLVSYALPDEGTLGRATWHLGANTWLLWFLILRRRILLAWCGGLGMLAVTVVWAAVAGRGALAGLLLASPQVLLLAIATLFGSALRRSAARINALAQRSVDAAAAAGAVEAARRIQDQRADELAEVAVPALTAIASGEPLTEAMRRDIVHVEAQLRDSVRGRALAMPPIVEAAKRARERGVNVTLLDDRGAALSGAQMLTIMGATQRALDAARGGTVTVRLLPVGRDDLLTIVAQDDESTERVAVPAAAVGGE